MERICRYSKYLLLALFVSYVGSLAVFTHVHIEGGRVYVHAHPFKQNPDAPFHHHSFHALQTLDAVSSFASTPLQFVSLVVYIPNDFYSLYLDNPVRGILCSVLRANLSLRAPPVA